MAFTDAGISSTLGNSLTLEYHQRNIERASQAISSAWFCQLKIWLVMIATFTAVILFCPFERWLGLDIDHSTFALTSALMCGWALVGQQTATLSSLYRAGGRYDQFIGLSAHWKIVELVGTVGFLWMGARLGLLAAVLLAARLGYLWCCWRSARGLLPDVQISSSDASWAKFREMLPSGLSFMSFSLGAGLINQGTALVVNHAFGPASVAVVSSCRQLVRVYLSVTSIAFTAIQPEMTYVYSQGDTARGLELQRRALRMAIYAAPPFCILVAGLGPWAMSIWTRGTIPVNAATMLLFSIETCLMAIGNVAVMTAWSMNKNVRIAVVYGTAHTLALALVAALARALGISAIPVIFSVAGLAYVGVSLVSSARIVNLSAMELLRRSLSLKQPVWR